jgi:exonuclease SbcC
VAKNDASAAKAAAEGAQAVFEAARSAHEAAHLAAGLKPGECCPVCQRELPSDFAVPEAPTVLGSAEAEAKRLHAIHEDKRERATKAAARVETLIQQVATARLAVATAERQEADALAAGATYFADLDLTRSDADLLTTHAHAATAATAAYETAVNDLAAKTARIAAEEAAIAERSRSLEERHAQLEREKTRVKTERRTISTSLKALPADYRPSSTSMKELKETESRCSERLTDLQQLEKAVRVGTEEIEKIDHRIATVQKRKADEIDSPRRDATSHARDVAQKLREANQSLKLSRQPPDTAALAAHIGWVAEIVRLARDAAKELEANAVAAEASADEAAKAAEQVLKAATEAAERELAGADAFHRELDSRRASLLAAERARDAAAEQIPNAARLDDSIARLGRRRDALDELATCLGDGHFIKWLVERRQQLLLAVASEILADMTGDRYRFAADFTIVDGRTGVGRQPSTLSGGESFMASLSLALGMAEIAARGGGRIGSLYLDEGFGTLDPNSLDEAVTALELRARAGQMILIVSHLPAIAQRIDRVLQVRPDPTGATPEWLDDYDRESLLLDAASEVVS